MPYNFTNREAYPPLLEQVTPMGIIISPAVRLLDVPNCTGKSIVPGEPIILLGHIGISQEVVLPGEDFTLHVGAVVDFLLDPAQASNVFVDEVIYFDLALAANGVYAPGYARNGSAPTNGYKLGVSMPIYEGPMGPKPVVGTRRIAAKPGQTRVRVAMDIGSGTSYGTVQDWNGA